MPLTHLGVIRANGSDASVFLQGQLTQDVASMGPGHARLSGYCSAKGRLLATVTLWKTAPDEFLLVCSADLLAATLKRLSMYVLRAKCKLSDASADIALWGLAGTEMTSWLAEAAPPSAWERRDRGTAAQVIRLPDVQGVPRFLWARPADEADPGLPALPLADWRWWEVLSGIPQVVTATVEQFVPQMVNLELVGGVNFKKGCFPGQEVVARSQYRGTIKRRAHLFMSEAAARPGQEVFHSADPDQPAGMVVDAASLDAAHCALVEIKLDALEDGCLTLGSPSGPLLRQIALPYEVLQEAA